jgi:hypothetical protein
LPANRAFFWRVLVYDAAGQYSNWSAVRHFYTKLAAPLLVNPGNTATIPSPVSLQWASVSEATGYTVQLSTTPNFSSMLVNKGVIATTYTVVISLTKGKVFY